jgi:hypothetical protein
MLGQLFLISEDCKTSPAVERLSMFSIQMLSAVNQSGSTLDVKR